MSALVGYDSSSDEDHVVKSAPQQVSPSKANVALNGALRRKSDVQQKEQQIHAANAASSGEGLIGPLSDPAAQPNGTVRTEEQVPSPIALAEMSERDAIRHLTQPTVPASSLPLSPPGSPDPAANERFRRFLELKAKGVHFNEDLARKTSFRNPSLLSTMMSKVGVDEKAQYNTSLPLDLWDPTSLPDWAYKEGLLKSQQEIQVQSDANKKRLSAAGKRTIDFTPETGSGGSSRRSTPGQHSKRRRP